MLLCYTRVTHGGWATMDFGFLASGNYGFKYFSFNCSASTLQGVRVQRGHLVSVSFRGCV